MEVGGSGESGRRIISQINVTPFVDVMLVLLIIFMVTAPMMKEGIDVNLPEVNASGLRTVEEPVIVTVDAKGKLFINETFVTKKELNVKLRAIFKNKADKMVLLRADTMVPYGSVATAMAGIRAAGVQKIGMMTEPVGTKRRKGGGKK